MERIDHVLVEQDSLLFEIVNKSLKKRSITNYSAQELSILGSVYLNKSRQCVNCPVKSGDYVRVHFVPKRFNCAWDFSKLIKYEDDFLLVASKPFGLPSIPTLDNVKENLQSQLEQHTSQKLFPIHRLDQPTTGLILFAKNSSAAKQLSKLMEKREIKKSYRCLTKTPAPTGRQIHFMKKSDRAPKVLDKLESPEFSLKCELNILDSRAVENEKDDFRGDHQLYPKSSDLQKEPRYLTRMELVSGRTHQIRAQLKYLGKPIIGDELYGLTGDKDVFALQADRLWFNFNQESFQFSL